MPVEAPASGVVVESGPVVYDDAAADEEEDEDEEACVSAMELMGANGKFEHNQCFNEAFKTQRAAAGTLVTL